MIRTTVKRVLHRTGVLKGVARRTPDRIAILLYHGVRRADGDPLREKGDEKFTSVETLERQIQICREYGTVIPLSVAISGGPLPPNPIVLTFDDGYANNWALAFPLLQKYGVPATIFLATGFLDKETFLWMDWFDHVFANAPDGIWKVPAGGQMETLDFRNADARERTRGAVKDRMKRISIEDTHRFLEVLQGEWGIPYGWETIPRPLQPLSWGHVRDMARSGIVEFGAHTVSHPVLSRCDRERQTLEIHVSKRRIEEELDRLCPAFAYPNGRAADFSGETTEILRACGITAALTTERGFAVPSKLDPLRLPRWGAPRNEIELAYLLAR